MSDLGKKAMDAQYALIEYNEAWQAATDLADSDETAFMAGWNAARERIAQQDAEIAMLRKGCPYEEENETLKGLLRRCYEALTYANPMSLEPQDIERHKAVIAAVDQQLQPKGEQG